MPYIKQEHRPQFDSKINDLSLHLQSHTTDFNTIYLVIKTLILKSVKPKRYRQMMEVTGLLENVRQEFARRIIGDTNFVAPKTMFLKYPNFDTETFSIDLNTETERLAFFVREGCGDIYGNLNYCITSLISKTYKQSIGMYALEIIFTLRTLKEDFYNTIMAPYEDQKIEENGDVY